MWFLRQAGLAPLQAFLREPSSPSSLPAMRVYLIRHGETVDNVANLYAGSRDSDLTNHGVQQAIRLGQFFKSSNVQLTHVFSSRLKRAVLTAKLVCDAQPVIRDGNGQIIEPIVKQIPELAEQDFGSYEGVSFIARDPVSKLSGKALHRSLHKDDQGFVDVETKESMSLRVDIFLNDHLAPIMQSTEQKRTAIAIVSHGIMLSVLWRRLLQRLPPKSVSVQKGVVARNGSFDLERLGGWSNTGYLELNIECHPIGMSPKAQPLSSSVKKAGETTNVTVSSVVNPVTTEGVSSSPTDLQPVMDMSKYFDHVFKSSITTICAVNSREHLQGLKRTGGGVGSSKHDEKQKTIDSFFKRRKII